MTINNKKDWWQVVDDNWEYLLGIISDQMDLDYMAFEIPGDGTSKPLGRTIAEELEHLKHNRSEKLARYFHGAWGLASDAYAYSVPGWSILCDLCSEEYVLYEVEGNEYGLGCA